MNVIEQRERLRVGLSAIQENSRKLGGKINAKAKKFRVMPNELFCSAKLDDKANVVYCLHNNLWTIGVSKLPPTKEKLAGGCNSKFMPIDATQEEVEKEGVMFSEFIEYQEKFIEIAPGFLKKCVALLDALESAPSDESILKVQEIDNMFGEALENIEGDEGEEDEEVVS